MIQIKVGLLFNIVFLVSNSMATTVVSLVESTASSHPVQGTDTNRKIFGGISGDVTKCANTSSTSLCNTCEGVTLTTLTSETLIPCNESAVHDNLQLQFSITTDTSSLKGGYPAIFYTASGGTKTEFKIDKTQTIAIKSPINISVPWADVCQTISGASGTATCAGITSGSKGDFSVGIVKANEDTINEPVTFEINILSLGSTDRYHPDCITGGTGTKGGFCQFEVLAGDEKVKIINMNESQTVSTVAGGNILALRFFHNEVPSSHCDGSTSGATLLSDLVSTASPLTLSTSKYREEVVTNIDKSIELPEERLLIKGLENDKCFGFVMASEDEAKNIGYFTPASYISTHHPIKKLTARPGKVTGLLNDDENCAVIALFGNSHPIVGFLRKFRDQVLKQLSIGRAITKFYYVFSPMVLSTLSIYYFLILLILALLPTVRRRFVKIN